MQITIIYIEAKCRAFNNIDNTLKHTLELSILAAQFKYPSMYLAQHLKATT